MYLSTSGPLLATQISPLIKIWHAGPLTWFMVTERPLLASRSCAVCKTKNAGDSLLIHSKCKQTNKVSSSIFCLKLSKQVNADIRAVEQFQSSCCIVWAASPAAATQFSLVFAVGSKEAPLMMNFHPRGTKPEALSQENQRTGSMDEWNDLEGCGCARACVWERRRWRILNYMSGIHIPNSRGQQRADKPFALPQLGDKETKKKSDVTGPFPLRKPPHVNKAAWDGAASVLKLLDEKLDFFSTKTQPEVTVRAMEPVGHWTGSGIMSMEDPFFVVKGSDCFLCNPVVRANANRG